MPKQRWDLGHWTERLNWWQLSALFGTIVLADRGTKLLAIKYLQHQFYVLTPCLNLELAYNHGVSWGMFSTNGLGTRCFLSGLIFALFGCLRLHTYYRARRGRPVWGELLVLAGALGNLWDRCLYGAVVDFIALHWGAWYF